MKPAVPPEEHQVPLRQLRRVRWAVRASLTLGVAASVAANILHADQNPIAQTIAAWPPLALLLTVELISRVPVHRRSLAAVRLVATGAIASIAAWVSYWHMAGVAARYGESGAAPYLLPLSVDGLVVVASVSLVELAGRIREAETAAGAVATPAPPVPATVPAGAVAAPAAVPRSTAATVAEGATVVTAEHPEPDLVEAKPLVPARATAPWVTGPDEQAPPLDPAPPIGSMLSQRLAAGRSRGTGQRRAAGAGAGEPDVAPAGTSAGSRTGASRPAASRTAAASSRQPTTARVMPGETAARKGRPVEETRRLAAALTAEQPHLTPDEVARQLGISTRRLKAVLA